jgi:ABC-type transporter Mla maintaining outer membrane lipid asymmetry ATPase subunit MlaF
VLRDVSFRYGDMVVLHETSLVVPSGGALVVTGDNGVGKSTLLYVCAGLLQPTAGEVLLDGHGTDASHPSALFRLGVRRGFVFQQGGLFSNMSALANVTLALGYHADVLGIDQAEITRRARAALREAGVEPGDIHSSPAHLSFGVRKRVALARALAIQPNFLFFDDPDTGLDAANVSLVHDLLERLRDDPSVTMVVATNHDDLIDRLGVRPHVLVAGRLIERAEEG